MLDTFSIFCAEKVYQFQRLALFKPPLQYPSNYLGVRFSDVGDRGIMNTYYVCFLYNI